MGFVSVRSLKCLWLSLTSSPYILSIKRLKRWSFVQVLCMQKGEKKISFHTVSRKNPNRNRKTTNKYKNIALCNIVLATQMKFGTKIITFSFNALAKRENFDCRKLMPTNSVIIY